MSIIGLESKKRFKNIFRYHWQSFKQKYPCFDKARYNEAVEKMLSCGTESNGYTEYRCLECGLDVRRVAFTCKSSFCLSCGKIYSDSVVSQISKTLHAGVVYRHVVLTVPEQLRQIFFNSRDTNKLYGALMRVSYECLEDVVSVVRRQRVKIGVIVVIHTHSRSGAYNPHVHIIMTDGGINEEKEKWVDLKCFPYEILHKKWQYHLLKMVKEQCGERVKGVVDKLWKEYPKGFVAHAKEGKAPEDSSGLAKYLAKYVASPPISIKRIIKYDAKTVTYYYKDHRTGQRKIETVSVETFIGRMIQHILSKGFQRIRYYGLQATKSFSKWRDVIVSGLKKIGRVIKGCYQIIAGQNYRERYAKAFGTDPYICRHCGCEMKLWQIWYPKYGLIMASGVG